MVADFDGQVAASSEMLLHLHNVRQGALHDVVIVMMVLMMVMSSAFDGSLPQGHRERVALLLFFLATAVGDCSSQ